MRSTLRRTRSAARPGSRSTSARRHRYSTERFFPSIQPSSRSRRNTSMLGFGPAESEQTNTERFLQAAGRRRQRTRIARRQSRRVHYATPAMQFILVVEFFTLSNETRNSSTAFAGMVFGTPVSRYARCGPTLIRRLPPARMPSTPYSSPAIATARCGARYLLFSATQSPRFKEKAVLDLNHVHPRSAVRPSPTSRSWYSTPPRPVSFALGSVALPKLLSILLQRLLVGLCGHMLQSPLFAASRRAATTPVRQWPWRRSPPVAQVP